MSEPTERRNWHLEKTISISHIFSTITAIVAVVIIGAQFNTRLALVEQAIINQKATTVEQDAALATSKQETQQALRDINAKLDHLLERK